MKPGFQMLILLVLMVLLTLLGCVVVQRINAEEKAPLPAEEYVHPPREEEVSRVSPAGELLSQRRESNQRFAQGETPSGIGVSPSESLSHNGQGGCGPRWIPRGEAPSETGGGHQGGTGSPLEPCPDASPGLGLPQQSSRLESLSHNGQGGVRAPVGFPGETISEMEEEPETEQEPEQETEPEPEPEPETRVFLGQFWCTGYDDCESCCGKTDGITSSGTRATAGRTIAAGSQFPIGTRLYIEGIGERTVEDRGGGIQGTNLDIFCENHPACYAVTGWHDVYLICDGGNVPVIEE